MDAPLFAVLDSLPYAAFRLSSLVV